MRSLLTCVPFFVAAVGALPAATPPANRGPLPDPLQTANGTRVTTAAQWTTQRRPEVLNLFASEIYGRTPATSPSQIGFTLMEKDAPALAGAATRRVVDIKYRGPGGDGAIPVHIYTPAASVKPKGCFILIVNRDRSIITDAEADPKEFWPVREIVARGYVAVAFHNSDAALDSKTQGLDSGVFRAFGPRAAQRAPDDWAVIGAWAWGASRVVDYLLSAPEWRTLPIAVVGHSRGGKAALWCGAQDERIALTISNDSGSTGAALARRTRGETVKRINDAFPHWFNGNYKKYNDRESTLPVDQHMLVALMAPRLVYVASAADDAHADPEAEFGSCVAAEPVFRLFGLQGVGATSFPSVNQPLHGGAIGYHVRPGKHDLTKLDWSRYMDFADRHLGAPKRP